MAGAHWEHETRRENWQMVTREDWEQDLTLRPVRMPVHGSGEVAGVDNIRGCESKFHHTDRYWCGTVRVGKTSHSKYCHRPVYRDWCRYDTWEWVPVAREVRVGDDTKGLLWAELSPSPLDRIVKEGRYDITLSYLDGESRETHVLHPKTESEFTDWEMGEPVSVELYNIGIVRDVVRINKVALEAR
jgi:hypothetical protein